MPCRSLAVSSFLYHFLTTEPYSPSIIRIAKHIGTRTKTPTSWTGKLIGCSIRRRTVVGSPPTVRPSTSHKRWLLVGVTAHRVRGLHRHCDEAGRDPVALTLDFSRDATLFRGFSGAGKTSLMSAICWCLTGYGHRSKDFPLLCIFRSIFRSRATTIPAPMPDLNCRLSCRSRPKRNYSRSMANEGRHMGSPQVSIAGGWQRGGGRTSSRTGRQEKLRGKRMNSP